MATATEMIPFVEEPITFPIALGSLKALIDDYSDLTIAGVEDKEGEAAVHKARMHLKEKRVSIDKRREELKAPVIARGKSIDSMAKEMIELIAPAEARLQSEESRITKERDRIKAEKEEAERQAVQVRVDALAAVGKSISFSLAKAMTPEEYAADLAAATEAKRIADEKAKQEAEEQARKEAEEAAQRKAEAERLAAQKAEQDRIAAEQKAEADRLAAERKKIDDEKAAAERKATEAKAQQEQAEKVARMKKEFAEHAASEAREMVSRKEAAAKEKAEKAEATRLRKEARRPDKEKILAFAVAIAAVDVPSLSKSSVNAQVRLHEIMDHVQAEIETLIARMEGE